MDHPSRSQAFSPDQRNQQNPLANYQFSPDELRVLRECNTESFFQRSLPFGTGLGLAAYYGVQTGYLKPNIKYGAIPKIVVGVIVGYFMGKISYQRKCAEKLMMIPDSRLADILRQRSKGSMVENFSQDASLSLAPFTSEVPEVYSDEKQSPLVDDIFSRPTFSSLDDTYRPPYKDQELPADNTKIETLKPKTTYEEIRRRNREQLRNSRTASTPNDDFDASQDFGTSEVKTKKNKYGDTWIN